MTPQRRRGVTVLALGSAQTLGWASSYYLPAIVAPPMARDLGLQTTWIFGAFSMALLVSAALGPRVGRFIDARGGRAMLTASSLVFAAGLAALASCQGAPGLLLAWALIGVAMAMGLYDAAFATLAGLFGAQARGPITGVTLMAGFASTLGWPLTAALEQEFGWRAACLVWAGAHLLIGLPLHRGLLPRSTAVPAPLAPPLAPPPDQPPGWTLALLAWVFAVGWFVSTAMAAHLPRLLQEGGASMAAAIAAAALLGPAQVAARLVEFGLMRRAHPLLSACLAASLHPVGAALFALFGLPAAALALLHGAGNGLLTIAVGTLPLALFGASGYGERQGWLVAPARVAQAGAPLLFGLLLDRLGVNALAVTAGLLLSALAALLLIGLQLREARSRAGAKRRIGLH